MVMAMAKSTNGETMIAIVFQNPATGLPNRIESTSVRGKLRRQLSHVIGLKNGMPLTESAVILRACH